MIPYQIVKTTLGQQTRYVSRMIVTQVYDRTRLAQRMAERHPGLLEADIVRVLDAFQTTVDKLCHEGAAVNLEGFVRFAPALAGAFSGPDDPFDRTRHELRVNAAVSKTFNRRFRQTSHPRRRNVDPAGPILQTVDDLASNSSNQMVTSGNIVALRGSRLRIDVDNPLDYLRFVDASDSARWVAIAQFHRRVPSECVFLMPTVDFARGYFEVSNCLRTRTPRTDRSVVVAVG